MNLSKKEIYDGGSVTKQFGEMTIEPITPRVGVLEYHMAYQKCYSSTSMLFLDTQSLGCVTIHIVILWASEMVEARTQAAQMES